MAKKWLSPLFLGLGVWFLLTGTLQARQYYFQALDSLGGVGSAGWGLNNYGQVVGWAANVPGQARAGEWFGSGAPLDLEAGDNSCGVGINSSGQIAGTSTLANAQAFFWDPATQAAQNLVNTLGGTRSWGNAINDQGQMVGYAETAKTGTIYVHAYLWNKTAQTMQDLNTLGGAESWGNAINAKGQICGTSGTVVAIDPAYHAFFRDPANGQLQDQGTLGGDWSAALAMNNLSQMAGWSHAQVGGYVHAFFLPAPGAKMQDLGVLTGNYSQAQSINDRGEVVGEYGTATATGVTSRAAFIWTAAQGMKNLNPLVPNLPQGVTLASALAINYRGQIVGYTSDNRGFLLSPTGSMPFVPLLLGD